MSPLRPMVPRRDEGLIRTGGRSPIARRSHGARIPVLLMLAMLATAGAAVAADEDCLACHADASLSMERKGHAISLFVDRNQLGDSRHRGLSCTDCHQGLNPEELPHAKRIRSVQCMECHGEPAASHPFHSSFARARGDNGEPGTSCKGCHGTHAVEAPAEAGSRFAPPRLPEACGACHRAIADQFSASEHGAALVRGATGAPDCLACHRQPITPARAGGQSAELKIAQEKICLACHLEDPEVRARMGPDAGFISAYDRSVHGKALRAGNATAPTCIDCHGAHEMKHGIDPQARVSKSRIPETCAGCHAEIAAQYGQSAHAAAFRKGAAEAPVCTDCHGEHDILHHSDPAARVAAANVSTQVCSPCHSSVALSSKYGIASDRFQTFADSFHGLALRSGALEVANCSSCHGAHDIKPSSDPASRVHKANLAATCGQCHPGANERFAVGAVHLTMTAEQEPVLYWIATIYVALIVATVGGMFAHNLLDFARKSSRRLAIRKGTVTEHPPSRALYVRMSLSERIQHGCLMLSFTVLVVTGFMLSYPDAWWVAGIRRMSGGVFELRSLVHRIAAVVMVTASIWHIGYLGFTKRGRKLLYDLLPARADLREAAATLRYNLRLTGIKPSYGRFSYVEKTEYWALVWGTVVMAVTGVVLWFEDASIGLLTKLGWDIGRTIHFYEAWLATLAIIVWHVYYVIFNPDVYPMNMAWLTGKLTEQEMAEEHPRELEAIKGAARDEQQAS